MDMTNMKISHPLPKIPNHTCRNCASFLRENMQRLIMQSDGSGIPVSVLIAKGEKYNAKHLVEVAQCTWGPLWTPVTTDHWCDQFKLDGAISPLKLVPMGPRTTDLCD